MVSLRLALVSERGNCHGPVWKVIISVPTQQVSKRAAHACYFKNALVVVQKG